MLLKDILLYKLKSNKTEIGVVLVNIAKRLKETIARPTATYPFIQPLLYFSSFHTN